MNLCNENMAEFPRISLCIPTYNSEKSIGFCFDRIKSQDYPKELVEILIVDGGSNDCTLEICRKSADKIINNPDKIEEKGRALGVREASGEIIAFIDADNLLNDVNFLRKMVSPFIDNDKAVFSEPKFYSCRNRDDIITKYISLIGADDPVAVYLGIYDRYCYFKSDWTDSPYEVLSGNDTYEIIRLKNINKMPPLGANGCFMKRKALLDIKYDPFIHTDAIHNLLINNNLFAKVNTGVVHKQDGSFVNFLRKKIRRLNRDYKGLQREYYFPISKMKLIVLFLKCFLVFPLIIDAIIGYKNKKDKIWLLHPLMVLLTLGAYIYAFLLKGIRKYGIR